MRKVFLFSVFAAALCAVSAQAQMGLGKPDPEDAKQLAKAQKEYDATKSAFKHHNSAQSKQAYVAAADRYAMISMMSAALPPKEKYRQALRLYREVLKTDPKNHEAKTNSDLIISIYRSMHRPVPN